PAALGPRADVAINLAGRPRRSPGQLNVLGKGFIARLVARVPIAIEDRAVVERDRMGVRLARLKRVRALHPIGVFRLELLEIAARAAARKASVPLRSLRWTAA